MLPWGCAPVYTFEAGTLVAQVDSNTRKATMLSFEGCSVRHAQALNFASRATCKTGSRVLLLEVVEWWAHRQQFRAISQAALFPWKARRASTAPLVALLRVQGVNQHASICAPRLQWVQVSADAS